MLPLQLLKGCVPRVVEVRGERLLGLRLQVLEILVEAESRVRLSRGGEAQVGGGGKLRL